MPVQSPPYRCWRLCVGSRGPVAADIMIAKEGFVRNEGYLWHRQWYSSL